MTTDGLRQRMCGWAGAALVLMNVATLLCGDFAGSDARMPCCLIVADGGAPPSVGPCCAVDERGQTEPARVAASVDWGGKSAADSTPFIASARVVCQHPALPMRAASQVRIVAPPPDTHLLLSVFLI